MKEDRRIRRTKKLLRQALAQLMLEKPFKDITVTDLVERADINRGTFYVHYRDVYDLRNQIEDEVVAVFDSIIREMEFQPAERALRQLIQHAIDYLEEVKTIVCSLMHDDSNNGLEYKIIRVIEQWRLRMIHSDTLREQYIARYMSCGITALIKKWLEEDSISKEELSELLDELLRPFS